MLTPQGIAELEKVLVGLKASGLAIIFITHKLHEATAIGDRVSMLKAGRVVGSLEPEVLRASTRGGAPREIVGHDVRRARRPTASQRGDREGPRRSRAQSAGAVGRPCCAGRPRRRAGGEPRSSASRRVARGPRRRDPRRGAAWTATASARSPRRSPGQRRPTAGRILLGGRRRRAAGRVGAPTPRPPLRDRRPARRRGRRALRGRRSTWSSSASARRLSGGAARVDRPRIDAHADAAHRGVRHPDPVASARVGEAHRRQHPEVRPRSRALVRSPGRRSSTSRPTASTCGRSPRSCEQASGARRSGASPSLVISTDLDELIDLCDRVAVMYARRASPAMVEDDAGCGGARGRAHGRGRGMRPGTPATRPSVEARCRVAAARLLTLDPACSLALPGSCSRSSGATRRVLQRHRAGRLGWPGLQESIIRMAPLLLIAARADRRVPGRPLEPRRRRAVPARRRVRGGPRAVRSVDRAGAGSGRRRDGHRRGVGGAVDGRPGGAPGLVRRQRDHHDADDVASSASRLPTCW